MTIAFYNGGVRVVDLAGLDDGKGMKAIGSYMTDNADSWSFKARGRDRSGDFYAYGNDMARGLDVYRYDADARGDERRHVAARPRARRARLAPR